jgi:hypothetical protein
MQMLWHGMKDDSLQGVKPDPPQNKSFFTHLVVSHSRIWL